MPKNSSTIHVGVLLAFIFKDISSFKFRFDRQKQSFLQPVLLKQMKTVAHGLCIHSLPPSRVRHLNHLKLFPWQFDLNLLHLAFLETCDVI